MAAISEIPAHLVELWNSMYPSVFLSHYLKVATCVFGILAVVLDASITRPSQPVVLDTAFFFNFWICALGTTCFCFLAAGWVPGFRTRTIPFKVAIAAPVVELRIEPSIHVLVVYSNS